MECVDLEGNNQMLYSFITSLCLFMVAYVMAFLLIKNDPQKRRYIRIPFQLVPVLTGCAIVLMLHGREISSVVFSGDEFIGVSILGPLGYFLFYLVMGKDPKAPFFLTIIKTLYISWSIILSVREHFICGDNIMLYAEEIAVAIAAFDIFDTVKDFLEKIDEAGEQTV